MSTDESRPEDQRKQARIEVPGKLRVVDRQDGSEIGQLVNISEDGMMLLLDRPLAGNTILQLSLELAGHDDEDSALHVGVESLWCNRGSDESQYWAGFCIIDISDRDRERIRRLTG
jgi:hypothetical protein